MSTRYFILSKPLGSPIDDTDQQQIVSLAPTNVYLLPQVNLDYYVKNGLFECQLIEWCKQFCSKDKAFLDIGAHSGTYTISLADCAKVVYSFEPQKMTYYSLCGSVALSGKENVSCLQVGLGSPEQVGKQTLKIVSNDGGGSSLHSATGILREETIEIKTLDEYGLENIGFVKMDVEENELFVLKGALETIRKNKWPTILFESNFENVELFDYIRSIGYKDVIKVGGCHNMFLTVS